MNGFSSKHRPLIISGAPRSGTTLLNNLFDGHPEINFLITEGFLFEHLYNAGPQALDLFLEAAKCDVDRLIDGIRDRQLIPPLHKSYRQEKQKGTASVFSLDISWNEGAFRQRLSSQVGEIEDVGALWRILVDAILAGLSATPKTFACMKAPDYGRSSHAAARLVPDARTITILRDPIFALDSLKRSRNMRGEKRLTWPTFVNVLEEYRLMLDRIEDIPNGQGRIVRYEDLIADPRAVMRDLAEFVGIAFSASLLEPTMLGQSWPGLSSYSPTTGVDSAPSQRDIQSLCFEELSLIQYHLGGYSRYGYDLHRMSR